MKKRCFLGVVLGAFLLPVTGLFAQSVSDDITQLLLDVQKLKALKRLLSDMKQGYVMMNKGYEAVKGLSQGTFTLHKAYLDGLLAVSPVVGNYQKVVAIINKETMLVKEYQSANAFFRGSGKFSLGELDHFSGVYTNLLSGSLNNISELMMVVTAGQLRMNDAERLAAVDRIDGSLTEQLSFLRSFDDETALQALQRAKVQQDVGTLRGVYRIGP